MNEIRGARHPAARELRDEREACRLVTGVRKAHSPPLFPLVEQS
jgi:hypothetical protein